MRWEGLAVEGGWGAAQATCFVDDTTQQRSATVGWRMIVVLTQRAIDIQDRCSPHLSIV
jgi:hypothetical protein